MTTKKSRTKLSSQIEYAATATLQDKVEYREGLREYVARFKEALRTYRPLPYQEAFHKCTARRALIRKGNRTGGSLAMFVEVARAVLGLDPYDKYPKEGICVLLGWGERHIGNIFHRYLFQPGAFWHRQDAEGNWVSCRREDEGAEPAPPLVPEKYVKNIAWERANENIFNRALIENPNTGSKWEVLACNSKGDPNMLQGINVNLYAIDEDIEKSQWFVEAVMRTNSVKGLLRWAAYPQATNDAMLHLMEECEEQLGQENPAAVLFTASMWDNTYTSKEAKLQDIEALRPFGEDVVRRRIEGEIDLSPRRVYPSFDKTRHSVLHYAQDVKVCQALREMNYEPPLDWCRYATLDPGHDVFAVLFWCVPPPREYGEFAIVFDELYIRQCDSEKFGYAFKEKTKHADWQDFIIDSHGAKLTSFETGRSPRKAYQEQLEKRGIKAVHSGTSFTDGSDNIEGREGAVRDWLRIRVSDDPLIDGTPRLLIVPHKCTNLVREMLRFRKKTRNVGGEVLVLDEAERKSSPVHACECLEYGAAHGLPYVRPPIKVNNSTSFEIAMARRRERQERRRRYMAGASRGIILGARGA